MIVADYIADELARDGVKYVFGVGGANIEDMFAAVQRRRPRLQAVLGKHEHAAGTAADAYARITGGPGVVMVTSGGGAMNLVHALAEVRASRVPVLAIVGEPPSELANCLRITVGTALENERCVRALRPALMASRATATG